MLADDPIHHGPQRVACAREPERRRKRQQQQQAVDGDAGEREHGHRVGQRALHFRCVTSYVGAE